MKKKLVMIFALYLSTYAMNVNADNSVGNYSEKIKFELDGPQQEIKDENGFQISINEFYVNSNTITVKMPQYWSVRLYRNDSTYKLENLVKTENDCYSVKEINYDPEQGIEYNSKIKVRYRNGYGLNTPGVYLLKLQENIEPENPNYSASSCPSLKNRKNVPLKKGEKLTFVFTGDDGIYAGTLVYKDSQTIAEENQKIEEEQRKQNEQKQEQQRRQQKLLEDNMLKHIRENDHKTWYQRLGDNIEDTWANVKGWWKG